jgi:hypothetical protein
MKIVPGVGAPGEYQTLVATGADSAGGWVLMRYESPTVARFGCDCWGAYNVWGDPVPLPPDTPVDVEIYSDRLYPATEERFKTFFSSSSFAEVRDRCLIRVDGRTVTDLRRPACHPGVPGRISILRNHLSAYLGTDFRGRVISVDRVGTP